MSLRTAEADSDLNHANYNEKDAMLIVIQNLIAENLELKRRLNNHENKCSAPVQAVKESHEIYAERHNERAAEISNYNKLKPARKTEVPIERSCSYCGDYHRNGKEYCKAYGKICTKCCKINHIEKACRSWAECLKRCKSLPPRIEKQQDSRRITTERSSDKNYLKQKRRNGKKINPNVSYDSVCKKPEKTYTKDKVVSDVQNLEKKQNEINELQKKIAKSPSIRMTITNLEAEIKQLQEELLTKYNIADLDEAYAKYGNKANRKKHEFHFRKRKL